MRELQQDTRELNQTDLSEVDPEENSAEFMGILIKVHAVNKHYLILHSINCGFKFLSDDRATLMFFVISMSLWCFCFVYVVLFSSGPGQAEENPRDH